MDNNFDLTAYLKSDITTPGKCSAKIGEQTGEDNVFGWLNELLKPSHERLAECVPPPAVYSPRRLRRVTGGHQIVVISCGNAVDVARIVAGIREV